MIKSKTCADYHVRPFPRMRRLVVDQAWLAQRKHSFDHDFVDGGPAARFVQYFKELIERGYGLTDDSVGQNDQAPLNHVAERDCSETLAQPFRSLP
jgi:hypothetical protein